MPVLRAVVWLLEGVRHAVRARLPDADSDRLHLPQLFNRKPSRIVKLRGVPDQSPQILGTWLQNGIEH